MIKVKKINKGKAKNVFKRKLINTNQGSATAETVLIIAILLVIIITVFYPQIQNLITTTMITLDSWFFSNLSSIGIT